MPMRPGRLGEAHRRSQFGTFVAQLVEQLALFVDGPLEAVDAQLTLGELRVEDRRAEQPGEQAGPREPGDDGGPAALARDDDERRFGDRL